MYKYIINNYNKLETFIRIMNNIVKYIEILRFNIKICF